MADAASSDGTTGFEKTVPVGPGLNVTVKITGGADAVARGNEVADRVAEMFMGSPANTLCEMLYNFSGTVECPFTFTAGGATYEIIPSFTPTGEQTDSGDSREDVEHLLCHGLTFVHLLVTGMIFCSGESGGGLGMLTDASSLLGAFSGPGVVVRLGSFPTSPYADGGGLGRTFGGSGYPWPYEEDRDSGFPGKI